MTIRKISKRRSAAGEVYRIKKSPVKKRPRKPSETLRIYGPPARRAFVTSLPCAACGVEGFSEQAHVAPAGEKGTGYKAGYEWIAPLCHERPIPMLAVLRFDVRMYVGCHRLYDCFKTEFRAAFPDFNPEKAATDCEAAWLAFSGSPKTGK